MRFCSHLPNGRTAAFLHHLGNTSYELRMAEFVADVKVFVSSLAARSTSFGRILSSQVDFLPSKDFSNCVTSLLSVS